MSSSDPNRMIRVKNTSRSELVVYTYTTLENEYPQDTLPFRLYLRFFDVLPRTCPCVTAFDSPEVSISEEADDETIPEEMDTGIEVILSADYGEQTETCFKVEPEVITIAPGAYEHLHVTLDPPEHRELAPNAVLLLRPLPTKPGGPGWYRREPDIQSVRLRAVQRSGELRVSDCKLRVKYCALGLPRGDIMRIRKTFRVLNVGNGHLHVQASTEGVWSIVLDESHQLTCGTGCVCVSKSTERVDTVALHLHPMSSNEMSVEVKIDTAEAWPKFETTESPPVQYEKCKKTVTPLHFYDDDNVLLTIPLILELEYPVVNIEPASIDFKFVTYGDTRKAYFTVSHSSRTEVLDLTVKWMGSTDFRLWPNTLHLPPGVSERVYVQYAAKFQTGSTEGIALVEYFDGPKGAGNWCRAQIPVRASPTRDFKCHIAIHDYTDDTELLPPGLLS